MRTRALLAVSTLLLASAAAPEPPAVPTTAFPTGVEVVNVDVVVLDQKGQPLEGLQAGDFTVLEDGRPQAVSTFEAVTLAESAEAPRRSERVSTNAAPPERGDRWYVVVFDDANITPRGTARARRAVVDFVRSGLRPGDQVMVVPTSGGPWWTGRIPDDTDEVVAFVERLKGTRFVDNTMARIYDHEALMIAEDRDPKMLGIVARRYFENNLIPESYPTDREVRAELDVSPGLSLIRAKAREVNRDAQARVQVALGVLERVARALGELRGRKDVLLVSEGFVLAASQPEFRELVQAARQANAAVHFVDARDPGGAVGQAAMPGGNAEFGRDVEERDTSTVLAFQALEAGGARSVALDTGGTITAATNLGQAMGQIARQSRAYYLLGYSSTNAKRDGKYRKIEVKVARADVDVRARRGYYAPSDKPERAVAASELPPPVRAGLDAPTPAGKLPLRLVSHVFGPQAGGKLQVLLLAEADVTGLGLAPRQGRYQAALDTYVVINGLDGGKPERNETRLDLDVPAEAWPQVSARGIPIRREFSLAPGAYQARLLVRDQASGQMGTVRHELVVPALDAFRVSTPVLTDTLQPGAEGQGPRPIPVARRTFRPGLRLACSFEVFGAAPDPARGGPRVSLAWELRRGADGSVVASAPERPLPPGTLGQVTALVQVPLPEGAAGDHVLVLKVRDEVSTRLLEVLEPFTVAR